MAFFVTCVHTFFAVGRSNFALELKPPASSALCFVLAFQLVTEVLDIMSRADQYKVGVSASLHSTGFSLRRWVFPYYFCFIQVFIFI